MRRFTSITRGAAVVLTLLATHAADARDFVTYEEFGATGDGVVDDLPAIRRAHEYANQQGLPVRSNPEAVYHLGTRALTAVIATDTDWSTSRFIIDDRDGVEDNKRPIFRVRSLLDPVRLQIPRLTRGQQHLDVRPSVDCLVLVENRGRRIFIRRGGNQNSGTTQREVFILRRDGMIEGGIDWDYEKITRVQAWPIDPEPLTIRGGIFTNHANRMVHESEDGRSDYWARNIRIERSNTVIDGLVHRVRSETDVGQPYHGFLFASRAANITFRNCVVDARKTYFKTGTGGTTVAMGTYGYQADLVVNFRMTNCRMGNDIHDRTRWGVAATNFMKNILIEDSELSRMDVHMGVSGDYIIRNTTLGHAGLNAIGRGRLIVEDSTIHANRFISFRQDYGSTWDGEVIIRNSRWAPPSSGRQTMFQMRNDGTHDFGYPCHMPRVIDIDGLTVDDSKAAQPLRFFSDPTGSPRKNERPFLYQLGEKLMLRNLTTASGRDLEFGGNHELAGTMEVIHQTP